MKTEDWHILIELKYCERCGELWFREAGSNASLCNPCATQEPKIAQRLENQKRPPGSAWYGPMSEVIENVQAVATEGRSA